MLKLNEFSHNHHLSRVKMLEKYIRRGISVIDFLQQSKRRNAPFSFVCKAYSTEKKKEYRYGKI